MRRGEIYRYDPVIPRPGQSTSRLIVSDDGLNQVDELPIVLGLRISASDPGGLLAVRLDPWGWASALAVEQVIKTRLIEKLDDADSASMEAVDTALRAAFGLD